MTKKDKKGTAIRLLKYLLDAKRLFIFALILTVISNYLALYIPLYSGKAIDAIGLDGNVNFELVFTNCKYMLACIILSALSSYFTEVLLVKLSAKITKRMRQEVFEHLQQLPVSYFDHHATGDIISRISYDIDTINTSLSSDLITILTTLITVVGSLIMMIRISTTLCLIFVVTTPIIVFITRHRAKKVRPMFSKRSHLLGKLNGFVEEMLSGYKTIKAYGKEDKIVERFDTNNIEAIDAYYEAEYEGSIVGPTVALVNNLSLSFVSGLGAILFLNKQISIGNISSFIMYSRKFSGPISELANIMAELQSAISAAERVFDLLDTPVEKEDDKDAITLENVSGDIAFENVHFSYEVGKEIIHGMNLHIHPGKLVAIVGPTGAGKTTIINMLMRFYDPTSGTIKLDGNDITKCTRASLQKQYSMVLQDTWLFDGTVYENVAYGKDNATKEEVIEVCKAAQIHDFIMTLKDGYDTRIQENGVNISKGQKQLLTIARAMLSETKMLILDEATSNVDSYTEQKIQSAIQELCKNKTAFVIAHRLSTIENADLIVVLRHGEIIEQGTHDELLKQKGFYASLFNAQWEG